MSAKESLFRIRSRHLQKPQTATNPRRSHATDRDDYRQSCGAGLGSGKRSKQDTACTLLPRSRQRPCRSPASAMPGQTNSSAYRTNPFMKHDLAANHFSRDSYSRWRFSRPARGFPWPPAEIRDHALVEAWLTDIGPTGIGATGVGWLLVGFVVILPILPPVLTQTRQMDILPSRSVNRAAWTDSYSLSPVPPHTCSMPKKLW